MLFINEEEFDYKKKYGVGKSKSGFDELQKEFPWWPNKPVELKYESSLITINKKDGKIITPTSRVIDCEAKFNKDGKDGVMRYATNRRKDENGNWHYSPSTEIIYGGKIFTAKDGEFLYFVWKYAKNVKNGDAGSKEKKRSFDFEFVHPIKSAKEESVRYVDLQKILNIVYGDNVSIKFLQKLAKGLFIPNVEGKTIIELQSDIMRNVNVSDERTKAKRFQDLLKIYDVDDILDYRAKINDAVERKVLLIEGRNVSLADPENKKAKELIFTIPSGPDLMPAIHDAFLDSERLRNRLDNLMIPYKAKEAVLDE